MGLAHGVEHALDWLPPWLVVLVLAFLPIVEVRASIPVAYLVYDMSVATTIALSAIGSILILPVAFVLLPALEKLGRRWDRLGRMLDWLWARTRRKSKKAERAGHAGLFTIVALPLPGAGTWTACIAAYVLGMPWRKSVPTILVGAVVEIAIITVVVVSGAKAWDWLLA